MIQDFDSIIEEMRAHGMPLPKEKTSLRVENSKEIMQNALNYFLRFEEIKAIWKPEYDKVSDWMQNTQGRGLFMYGNCGLGKSLLGRFVIPAILLKYCRKVVSVYSMSEVNKNIDEVLTRPIISIDDVGTEDIANSYGNRRSAFSEIMDDVEKKGKLIIISTNLNNDELIEKYGTRVMERIISTTTRIKFTGESLRK